MIIYSLVAEASKHIEERTISEGFGWDGTINVTLTGILIVFAMLVLLVVIIMVFGSIMKSVNNKNSVPNAPKVKIEKKKTVKKPAPVVVPAVSIASENEDEIIAVIAAAVNSMYEGTGKKPVIRAIKRAEMRGIRSAWATAGILENTRAF